MNESLHEDLLDSARKKSKHALYHLDLAPIHNDYHHRLSIQNDNQLQKKARSLVQRMKS